MPPIAYLRPSGTLTQQGAVHARLARRAALCLVAWLLAAAPGAVVSATEAGADAARAVGEAQVRAERDRLAQENAFLMRRLEGLEAQQQLAERLDQQATRLGDLAERLEERLDGAEGTGTPPMVGEDQHLSALQRNLATAEQRLRDAEARADELEARVAELAARLKQQQLTVDEALLRADKAEKLHAALNEAHARVKTENERLALELNTAKERQAEAMQRVLELDNRLQASTARAAVAAAPAQSPTLVSDPPAPPAAAVVAAAEPSAESLARTTVVYEVRDADTLSRIAAKVYGDASAWQRIFDANRDLLDGPDDLSLGMRLIIP
jgi:LysM repeat protein